MSLNQRNKILFITGGAGFIGFSLIQYLLANRCYHIINIDKLTYAANQVSLNEVKDHPSYSFCQGDICDVKFLQTLFQEYNPFGVIHLAAETHVDRSIENAKDFIESNIVGTYTLLEVAKAYWKGLSSEAQKQFKFHHVSTDEVYGALGKDGLFNEESSYQPSSPYSASKAASDHLVSAWYKTYGLPAVITNCSNNYGPRQYPEKLIPLTITRALREEPIPIYGNGENIRDWLYVEDHAKALTKVFELGRIGETYNIGGQCEKTNLEVVCTICEALDKLKPPSSFKSYRKLIQYVSDRPGHDFRYAIDIRKIKEELGWLPETSFKEGIKKTILFQLGR